MSINHRKWDEFWAYAPWLMGVAVLLLALSVWGNSISLNSLSTYQLFPLFGLVAFSLMWTHYTVTAARRHFSIPRTVFSAYFKVTGWIVLVALVLHPGLLSWQLWSDGFGLPPDSYLRHYTSPQTAWVALLGTAAWLVFLAFELYRWFRARSWWRYVNWANELAMIAIFYHGATLGGNLQVAWFRWVWLLYGMSLVTLLVYLHTPEAGRKWETSNIVWCGVLAVAGVVAIAGVTLRLV